MIPRYTSKEFNLAKASDKLPCQCYNCTVIFYICKKYITQCLKGNVAHPNKYCSIKCKNKHTSKKEHVQCLNCNVMFEKTLNQIKTSPNHFCSRSCSASYNNKNKTTGNRRSKLEIYIEEQLTSLYPKLHIDYNKKDAIGSELDIYLPSLNLAFELNGIFHYEPIYGSYKLNQIQNNDISKSKACLDNKIDLCIIDSSGLKYFKPSNAQTYLDIIVNIINQRTSC